MNLFGGRKTPGGRGVRGRKRLEGDCERLAAREKLFEGKSDEGKF